MSSGPANAESLTSRLAQLRRAAPPTLGVGALVRAGVDIAPTPQPVESLEHRLLGLRKRIDASFSGLPGARTAERARDPLARRRRRWRIATAAAGLVVAVVANGGAMYFVPAYADALGDLPGVGSFLRWSGLAAGDLTQIDAASDHDGVRLRVSAAYADENATVVIFDYQGPAGATGVDIGGFDSLTLHDQFGHDYPATGAGFGEKSQRLRAGDDIAGYASFAPISGPVATLGARLTFRGVDFHTGGRAGDGAPAIIGGVWEVKFVLERHSATHTKLEPATVSGATYTFDDMSVTGGTHLAIKWHAAGPAVDAALAASEALARAAQPNGGQPTKNAPLSTDPTAPMRPYIPRLVDAGGRTLELGPTIGGPVFSGEDGRISGQLDYILTPAVYHLVLTTPDGTGFDRSITVP